MTRSAQLIFSLAALCTSVALAQTDQPDAVANSSSPVAYVYVARPTHIDAFAAASNGKLSLIGTPISGSVTGMSVNKSYLFGFNYTGDTTNVNAYTIASNGAIKLSKQTPIPDTSYCPTGPLQIDYSGKVVYVLIEDCDNTEEQFVQSYSIESKGALKLLGSSGVEGYNSLSTPQPTILGNNKFAYNAGCYSDSSGDYPSPFFATYTVESDGKMVTNSASFPAPPAYSGDGFACPELLAGDTSDHIVVTGQDFNYNTGEFDGPVYLATYTADSHGSLSTESTRKNMETVSPELFEVTAMSIDPTSKFLAVGDEGFEVFHWNGGGQVTKFSGVYLNSSSILQFGWDKAHHLYVLTSAGDLYVYTVTSSGVTEVSGSPYSIPESNGLIVLSL